MPIKVEGLPLLFKSFAAYDADLAKGMRARLAEAARVVSDEASALLANSPVSAAAVRPRSTGAAKVLVEETKRRTTGKRPDWGVHVMQRALVPALVNNEDKVRENIDGFLDELSAEFNA